MHNFNETGAGVPAFLAKLWRLVDDPDTNNLICWSKDGRSFIIQNQAQFARELLPLNYKHNNMASFIRQLNMYGFHKITSIDNGGLKFDRDEMEFSHPCFKRNSPFLLEHIKRKIANTKHIDEKAALKPEAVTKVLQDVKAMRGRQDSLDSRFSVMKQENEALWREIASLRQKHAKQQQIVNKLIQFLITIVQPSRNMATVKRHMQLMINDIPENARLRKTSDSESDCGPVIHELGEELLAESDELMEANSPYNHFAMGNEGEDMSPLNMERPNSSISQYDYSNQSVEDVLMNAVNGGNMNARFFVDTSGGASTSGSGVNSGGDTGGSATDGDLGQRTSSPSVIQSVYPDGSSIVYHVTEVPDAQPQGSPTAGKSAAAELFDDIADTGAVSGGSFSEENVLTTPMVREQMARTQLLKQKNKQRRQRPMAASKADTGNGSVDSSAAAKVQRVSSRRQAAAASGKRSGGLLKSATATAGAQSPAVATQITQPMSPQVTAIKQEEIDPMMFLNVYSDELTNDGCLISPNGVASLNNNANANTTNSGASNEVVYVPVNNGDNNAVLGQQQQPSGDQCKDLYDANQFMVNDMPTELFEDNSLMSQDSNFVDNFQIQQQQQPYGQTAGSAATLSNDDTSPSTSAAAKRSAGNAQARKSPNQNANNNNNTNNNNTNNTNTNGNNSNGNGSGNNWAVTKYKNDPQPPNAEIMRLSTADEVHGHLENVQDELDTLKDLLKGDGYSLDANTLMGAAGAPPSTASSNNANNNRYFLTQGLDGDFFTKLFNDNDLLGPYGLSFNNDLPAADKKVQGGGSELMTYQPMYDLSDIMSGMDDKTNDSDPALLPSLSSEGKSSARQSDDGGSAAIGVVAGGSGLNTPYHD